MNSQRLLCSQKAGGIKLSGIQNILVLDSKQYTIYIVQSQQDTFLFYNYTFKSESTNKIQANQWYQGFFPLNCTENYYKFPTF